MTVLEIMIVLAIIGGGAVLVRSGFRMITKADLVENATEFAAVMRRANQLAIEHGELHRVLLDLEDHQYIVEVCHGQTAIMRNEKLDQKESDVKDALERGKQRLGQMPDDAFSSGDPEEATKRTLAVAGAHVQDRTCVPAGDAITGDSTGKGWARKLSSGKGIKFKQVFVQHLDKAQTKGKVAIYFWPMGSSEKAVIEMTDGSETFSVLVFGLSGRVELRDGELKSVDDHMMRNAMGNKDAQRDAEGEH